MKTSGIALHGQMEIPALFIFTYKNDQCQSIKYQAEEKYRNIELKYAQQITKVKENINSEFMTCINTRILYSINDKFKRKYNTFLH